MVNIAYVVTLFYVRKQIHKMEKLSCIKVMEGSHSPETPWPGEVIKYTFRLTWMTTVYEFFVIQGMYIAPKIIYILFSSSSNKLFPKSIN